MGVAGEGLRRWRSSVGFGLREEEEEEGKDLQRRCAAYLWCDQVDAAANGEAETKLDDGGGARVQGRRKEEEEMKKQRKEKERGPQPYL